MRAIHSSDHGGASGNFWRIENGEGEELMTFAAPLDVTTEAAALALYEEMLTPPMADLAAIKADLKRAVDTSAEVERLRYITPGAGQAMTYQQKAAEAAACLDDAAPEPVDYPLLAAELGITAATLKDVATAVSMAHQAWRVIGAQIEAARLGAKAAIDAATDEAEARAVSPAWPTPPD